MNKRTFALVSVMTIALLALLTGSVHLAKAQDGMVISTVERIPSFDPAISHSSCSAGEREQCRNACLTNGPGPDVTQGSWALIGLRCTSVNTHEIPGQNQLACVCDWWDPYTPYEPGLACAPNHPSLPPCS